MLSKEDIILLFLENPNKLADEILNENVPKSDEIRTLICDLGDPRCAYLYAKWVDESSHSDTRQGVCKDPHYAYLYAEYVDKSLRSDTRKASCKNPGWAYNYAQNVDKSPHPDTRRATCKDPYWKEAYERWENSLKKK